MTKSVLIVDDSSAASTLMQIVQSCLSCGAIVARDGEEAVERVLEHRPDLILVEVEMRKTDGYEVCKRLRAIAGPNVPILLLAPRDDAEQSSLTQRSGANGHLVKPVASYELLARARLYFGA